ncbi:MAG: ferredoxin--NADP reductase [Neisseriaceae bacterium]|nr:ferredoxin--NADP reductase [Neisseriaceae bacterium]MCV2508859.1 ferredoxin--NADP reductase [Neisseriaceae bacterium]
MTEEKYSKEKVLWSKKYTDKLMAFAITRPENYQFKPGQFSRIGLPEDSGFIWRAYSIASSQNEDFLEYYVVLIEEGAMSQRLSQIKEGDEVLLDKTAFGFLLPERFESGKNLVMLATGSGIAPFLSQLKLAALWEQFDKIVLVHSVSYQDELISSELVNKLHDYPELASVLTRLQFVPVVTRNEVEGAFKERVPALITSGQLEQKIGFEFTPEDTRFLICGNPKMVQDTFKSLLDRGFAMHRNRLPGQIIMENGF